MLQLSDCGSLVIVGSRKRGHFPRSSSKSVGTWRVKAQGRVDSVAVSPSSSSLPAARDDDTWQRNLDGSASVVKELGQSPKPDGGSDQAETQKNPFSLPATFNRSISEGAPTVVVDQPESISPLDPPQQHPIEQPAGWALSTESASGASPRRSTHRSSGTIERHVEVGDIVILGAGAPTEYRMCPAIVTKLADLHCTVVVLDSERRIGIGECWPNYVDISMVESSKLRLDSRVVVHGMQGVRTKRLNGFPGVVAAHPRQGHPTFVNKPRNPDRPQLTVCVRFEDPQAAGEHSALIEPRFLLTYDMAVQEMSASLEDALSAQIARCAEIARSSSQDHVSAQQPTLPERHQRLPPATPSSIPPPEDTCSSTVVGKAPPNIETLPQPDQRLPFRGEASGRLPQSDYQCCFGWLRCPAMLRRRFLMGRGKITI